MCPENSQDLTRLLRAWSGGDAEALEKIVPLVEAEFRHLANRYMRRERAAYTLQSTALVNEAFLRLMGSKPVLWQDRFHFFAIAARTMRRILVGAARARMANKRGGQDERVTFDEGIALHNQKDRAIEALDDALAALAQTDERKVQVVELRFFAGFTVAETAEILGVSAETVMRDWKFAKAWLQDQLKAG